MRFVRRGSVLVLLFGLLWSFPAWGEIQNFHEVEEGFFRGAQPDEAAIQGLKDLGFRTVVCLRDEKRIIQWEKKIVEGKGMRFISIPLNWKRVPTDAEAEAFLSAVSPENRPIFVHCRQGRDRTGTMVALYRVAHLGWPVEEAYREAKRHGFRDTALPLRWFIFKRTEAFRRPLTPSTKRVIIEIVFYALEAGVALLGLLSGIVCLHKPKLAVQFQKDFYSRINWRLEPISIAKEYRNTRWMGGLLIGISLLLVVGLILFST